MPPKPEPIPVLLAWSGGKDSAWTLHRLQRDPAWQVRGLLTQVAHGSGRVSVHGIRPEVLRAQADATGLPLIEVALPEGADNIEYEAAFASGLRSAQSRWPEVRHVAFGDLFLADIREWRELLCARHGWDAVFPLFGEDTAELARAMIEAGLQATLCCVDRTQLDEGFLGRAFDLHLLDELPAGVDPCGEHGEFHTAVSAGPMFNVPLQLSRSAGAISDQRFAYCELTLMQSRLPGAHSAPPPDNTASRRHSMAQRFHLTLADPSLARGSDPELSFRAHGADEFAAELQAALRTPVLFERWRAQQPDPDEVDPALAVIDPDARVSGEQRDLKIDLIAITSIPGSVLRHRLRLLAGSGWSLHDVTAG